MPEPARAHRGHVTARLLTCLGLLIAVFAMHGPSSDHMMVMPAHGMSATTAQLGLTVPIPHHAAPHRVGGPAVANAGPGCTCDSPTTTMMSHGDCLATLRHPGALAAPAPFLTGTAAHAATAPGTATSACAAQRAPPQPELSGLGISRT